MAEMMMVMMMQNQKAESDKRIADLEKKLYNKGKGKGKAKGKGKKASKPKHTDAEKIKYYVANPEKWNSKLEGLIKHGLMPPQPAVPADWFHSANYKNKVKGTKAPTPNIAGATTFAPVAPLSMAAGAQGGETQTFIQNNPTAGMGAGSYGVNPRNYPSISQ